MKSEVETITPAYAAKELKAQEERIAKGIYHQRPLNDGTVDKYAGDMVAGHWMVNNQGLGFDEDGNLVDGRHRLWAVRRAGVPVDMLVVRGLPCNRKNDLLRVVDTIDTGRTRGIGAQLAIDGEKNVLTVAAAIRGIYLTACNFKKSTKASTFQARKILQMHSPYIQQTTSLLLRHRIARGPVVACLALYQNVYPRKAAKFLDGYVNMVGLSEGSPIIALSKYYRSSGGTKATVAHLQAVALALKHFDEDNSINSLRGTPIGADWLNDLDKKHTAEIRKVMNYKNQQDAKGEVS